jgi:DNA-binding NarL/FixJ family response regulator
MLNKGRVAPTKRTVTAMSNKCRIVIAEDHTILRDGLRALLVSDPEFDVVGEAGDGLEAIKAVQRLKPDLVIMDLSMPKMNGIGAIKEIKRAVPNAKIVVLTVHKNEEYILAAFQAGCEGYVLKYSGQEELMAVIRDVMKGRRGLSPSVSEVVLDAYLEAQKGQVGEPGRSLLTSRETEVLKLIAEGYRNKQIADLLDISAKTVERHRANLMKKLDLHSAPALTAFAVERGLICAEEKL